MRFSVSLVIAGLAFGCASDDDDRPAQKSGATTDSGAEAFRAAGVEGDPVPQPEDGAPPPAETASVSSVCTPSFAPYNGGVYGEWLGGDAAYSVLLGNGSTLWFFGDTFMQRNGGNTSRVGASMPGNTIGVSTCISGAFRITYNWRLDGNAVLPFFKVPTGLLPSGTSDPTKFKYWPAQPWLTNSVLYVPLLLAESVPGSYFGFQIVSTHVAIITNPAATPNLWNIQYRKLIDVPNTNGGEGVVRAGAYVYLINGGSVPLNGVNVPKTTLVRIEAAKIKADPVGIGSYLEYQSAGGPWVPGYNAQDALDLGLRANSGLTLKWDAVKAKWLALYSEFSGIKSTGVFAATAPRLRGPWTQLATPILRYPDNDPASPKYSPTAHCYAAYEHREFTATPATQFAFTYNCNDTDPIVRSNLGIYFPRFVRKPIPPY